MEKANRNITTQFIGGLYKMSQSDFPDSILKEAKKCILDYLGVTFAGVKMIREKSENILNFMDSSTEGVAVIGLNRKASIQNASLINGINSHVAELDDGERFAMMHPGAPILSALFPLAENKKISGYDLLRGIIVGYEAAIRISGALQPSMKDRGYHGTGTCGAIGAAIGVAAALNFSEQQMKDALSAAATSASGILKVIKDVSDLKPFNAGNAAQSGLLAAMMPLAGFKGPEDVLGGQLGFLSIMSDNYDITRLEFKKGDLASIQKIYRKPFAACRHCHPAIEAAIKISAKHRMDIDSIKSVAIKTYYWAVGGHDHTEIHGINSAKMSTPFSVAVALATGKAGINEFTEEKINDTRINSLTQKVSVESDETLSQLVPHKRAAIVHISTQNDEYYTERVDLPKGEPENPISENELNEKFVSLALYGNKSIGDCNQIIKHVWNIEEELNDLYALF